jgi:two-component system, LuxR family, sensor kinase FixL
MLTIANVSKAIFCVVAFAMLDWATFSAAVAPLGITPWNPAIGLAIAVVIIGGLGFAPLLAIAPFVSDLVVRALPFPWWVIGIEAAMVGVGYWCGLLVLLHRQTKFDPSLRQLRDLLLLAAVMAIAALFVAAGYSAVLLLLGYLSPPQLLESIVRYWVGEIIGFMVMTPFLLLMAFRYDFPRLSLEVLVQGVTVIIAVIVVVGVTDRAQLQLSFFLMLPIVWLALRYGFEGVTAGLLLLQICMMIALHLRSDIETDVTLVQAIMVMLTVSGLAIGLLVSERAEGERRLQLQQDAIARAARLGSMGEFAGALAHELNQPLMAASNYARATAAALNGVDPPRLIEARDAAEKVIEQVDRSAQVVRRLRDLIRVGRIETSPQRVGPLLDQCIAMARPALQKQPVQVDLALQSGLPLVTVDALQFQQVVTNLVRNAAEALIDAATEAPRVIISARHVAGAFVEISVIDNGPGFPPDFDASVNRPMASSKLDGLGIGLSLCRSIVKAHGGELIIERRMGGATVRFSVPIATEVTNA